ncbi:MAG: hypothetical protein ACRCSF_09005 [Mycobacteriaceae bacterium]
MHIRSQVLKTAATAVALIPFLGGIGAQANADTIPTESVRQAQARAYIEALVSHDSSQVRFTSDATRTELGFQTGFSGPQMSEDLNNGLQYKVIQGVRELEICEEGELVTTRYLLDSGYAGARLMTVEITETFIIPEDSIQTVVADIAFRSLL